MRPRNVNRRSCCHRMLSTGASPQAQLTEEHRALHHQQQWHVRGLMDVSRSKASRQAGSAQPAIRERRPGDAFAAAATKSKDQAVQLPSLAKNNSVFSKSLQRPALCLVQVEPQQPDSYVSIQLRYPRQPTSTNRSSGTTRAVSTPSRSTSNGKRGTSHGCWYWPCHLLTPKGFCCAVLAKR